MKRNWFLLLGGILVLCVLAGGVYKRTVLADKRIELTYQYKVTYTVEVTDVDSFAAQMYYPGMGLYFDEETVAGSVTEVARRPAASGKKDCYDLTLTVSASGSRLTPEGYGSYSVTDGKQYTFLSRFLTFEGYISQVNEA